ncbi:hypothetical protein HJC23_003749 [Cyclotella cryptica]|uniref:Alpha-L-glutamate ligase-related protein ATP-grasp domain-containing protein n=1 Tax=Cyclotella cryptica TaxID=29204 RepID=A0ABD3QTJ0_9STRA
MGQALSLPLKLASTTVTFYRGFFHYLLGPGRHAPYLASSPSYLQPPSPSNDPPPTPPITQSSSSFTLPQFTSTPLFAQHARIHLYTLASEFYLYHRPHYRKPSYRRDLLDNLSNVAIPGTGLSLRHFVQTKFLAFTSVLFLYPAVSLLSSLSLWIQTRFASSISQEYAVRLLAPDDWFHYWRLNSRLAALHALLNHVPPGYDMENKWTFLKEGHARNEEGGMGIHFYKNATVDGDWIIQERISNGEWVAKHLPQNAPLSTFRVITASRGALDVEKTNCDGGCTVEDIRALSCVFRAGRANAATDHDSIMFDVDVSTGKILGGTTNAHWYKLGLWNILPGRCTWRSWDHEITHHPDGDIAITGEVVPDIRSMLRLVEESHWKMCPDVPLVGWDVVLSSSEELPICLLEVNLSCNFFRGSFDRQVYLDFCEEMIGNLQDMRLAADREGKKLK